MMGTSVAGLTYHSRFQVLSAGEPAWAMDDRGNLYRFDGFYFSRRRRRHDSYSIVASWQTPGHGWLYPAECACPALITVASRRLEDSARHAPDVAA